MTSEVLLMNKHAVVIAADSAVTLMYEPHARYSKHANKIFDISIHGNIAATIFSSAEIDRVPWKLVLKLFREELSSQPPLAKLDNYVEKIIDFVQDNECLFPIDVRNAVLKSRFSYIVSRILEIIKNEFKDISNLEISEDKRKELMAKGIEYCNKIIEIDNDLFSRFNDCFTGLSFALEEEVREKFVKIDIYNIINWPQLIDVAKKIFLSRLPFLGYTGMLLTGYGSKDIFPGYIQVCIYGHIGKKLLWKISGRNSISHSNSSCIVPFAMTSMIDRFTDGFDNKLRDIILAESRKAFKAVFLDLGSAGYAIPEDISASIIDNRIEKFMKTWKEQSLEANLYPLRQILSHLSVQEMGNMAESLLILESLRERMTSASESVGGPIDVVAITKTEGLLWLKRKHFFNPELNPRYLERSKIAYHARDAVDKETNDVIA
ncbi:hypothetical protein [Candidatus Magnetaquicoccus inordinatus]|uniref:hypothetical protein n=1 Tax=Candidatus Magnetaquicoccus inordinatus TaxID=2496818 RepID=UPI00102D0419|nr:hypothetical protein [Candidatus Magnetaquicoccus inordinatus]